MLGQIQEILIHQTTPKYIEPKLKSINCTFFDIEIKIKLKIQ
jgi:hypothetical protein